MGDYIEQLRPTIEVIAQLHSNTWLDVLTYKVGDSELLTLTQEIDERRRTHEVGMLGIEHTATSREYLTRNQNFTPIWGCSVDSSHSEAGLGLGHVVQHADALVRGGVFRVSLYVEGDIGLDIGKPRDTHFLGRANHMQVEPLFYDPQNHPELVLVGKTAIPIAEKRDAYFFSDPPEYTRHDYEGPTKINVLKLKLSVPNSALDLQ